MSSVPPQAPESLRVLRDIRQELVTANRRLRAIYGLLFVVFVLPILLAAAFIALPLLAAR